MAYIETSDDKRKTVFRKEFEYLVLILMGEGFILLTRGYGFIGGGVPPPF